MNRLLIIKVLVFFVATDVCLPQDIIGDVGSTTSKELSAKVNDSSPNKTDVDTDGDIIFTSETMTESEIDNLTNTEYVTTEAAISTEQNYDDWTACSMDPCKNNGTCNQDIANSNLFNCTCGREFTDKLCTVADDCAVGPDGKLCTNGACVYEPDGKSRICRCFYNNFWDDVNKECKEIHPPCLPNPCLNGGTCSSKTDGYQCSCPLNYEGKTCARLNKCKKSNCANGKCISENRGTIKLCECKQGFYWNEDDWSCDEIQPPCLPNPCRNGGICSHLGIDDYNCTCKDRHEGKDCEFINLCRDVESENDTCENGQCVEERGTKSCKCNEGFYRDEEKGICRKITRPCFPNPCSNGGQCIVLSERSYTCSCSGGFMGKFCTDNDYCAMKGGNIFCGNATCQNDQELEIFTCACAENQYFDYTSRKCAGTDFCPLIRCNVYEACKNNTCDCNSNFKRNNSTGKCEANFCASNPCTDVNSKCVDSLEGYSCVCKDGFSFNGTHCNDAKCIFPDFNKCEQMCDSATEGNFKCGCYEGFELNEDNTTCKLVGNETCLNKTCTNAQCLKQGENEICACSPGYIEVDGHCIDLCSSGSLPNGYCPENKCESTSTGFRCKCEGKFITSEDKVTCSARKLCRSQEYGFQNCSSKNALCIEDTSSADGFKCKCSNGFVENQQGVCVDVCSLDVNQYHCSLLGAKCDVDEDGDDICKCPPYFDANQNTGMCNKRVSYSYLLSLPMDIATYKLAKEIRAYSNIPDGKMIADVRKIERDVQKSMEILFPQLYQVNVVSCREVYNYMFCKIELQFSSISEDDTKIIKSANLCQKNDKIPATKCLIPPSLILREEHVKSKMVIEPSDPCEPDIKDIICGSETDCLSFEPNFAFNCSCSQGYTARRRTYPYSDFSSFVEQCRDVDECMLSNPCPKNTKCLNTIGSFTCPCINGFRQEGNSIENGCVEICNPNPCVHGKCEVDGDHGFQCGCDSSYTGVVCDLQDKNFKRERTNTAIVGAVLGGALLVTIILFIASVVRLRKKKFADDPDTILYATEMTERRTNDTGAVNNAYQKE